MGGRDRVVVYLMLLLIGTSAIAGLLSCGLGEAQASRLAVLVPTIPKQQWNQTYFAKPFNINSEVGCDLVKCSGGDLILLGTTYYSVGAEYSALLIRIANNGTELWQHVFLAPPSRFLRCSTEGSSILDCTDGGFVFVGTAVNFGAGGTDVWLVRTDDMGNMQWNHTFGTVDGEWGLDVVQCQAGGFAVVGDRQNTTNLQRDFWVVRTDANGVHQWNQTYGDSAYEQAYSILECYDGGFAIVGTRQIQTDDNDVLVVRIGATGQFLWSRSYGSASQNSYDAGYSIIQTSDGGLAIVGRTELDKLWLLRLDSAGAHLWNRTYSSTYKSQGWSVVQCQDQGFAITGIAEVASKKNEVLLLRTDQDGSLLWNQTYGGSEHDDGRALIEYGEGAYVVIGLTYSFPTPGKSNVWVIFVTESSATVTSSPPPILGFPLLSIMIGTTIALVTTLVYRRKKWIAHPRGPAKTMCSLGRVRVLHANGSTLQ